MTEEEGGNKSTPNVGHSSGASTSLGSKEFENESADTSFDWDVWAFACHNLSSSDIKKQILRQDQDQDQLIKEMEALMRARTITVVRTGRTLSQKMQNVLEEGEDRGLLLTGKRRVVEDVAEATKKAEAGIDDLDLILEAIDLNALKCYDVVRKALDLKQKEIHERKVQIIEARMAHQDDEIIIEAGRECNRKLGDIMIEGRRGDLGNDPKITPEDQRMPINKICEDERLVQREAHNRFIKTQRGLASNTSPCHHHRELSQLQKKLGASASIRDRPAPALVWRQRDYQAAELEYIDQKDPEEKGYSWRPKDALKLGPKDSTTVKEKRMIHAGKEMLKGTLSGYGGSAFPNVKDEERVLQELEDGKV